jgi:hypothetical protein
MGVGLSSERMDTVLTSAGIGSSVQQDALARHEAIEIVATLGVASGSEGERSNDARFHRVVVLLVRLDILSGGHTTVFCVVNVKTSDDRAGAEHLGDTKPVGKRVEPKNVEEHYFNYHSGRVMFNGGGLVCAACPFFCRADAAFDIWHMLVFTAYVEL